METGEVEPVGRNEGRRIEKNVEAFGLGLLDPLERMLNPGEVRLRGIREEIVAAAVRRIEVVIQHRFIHAQLGRDHGHVGGSRAPQAVEFANAVHRVVVVEGQQEEIARAEGVRLAHQFQGVAGVRGEHQRVFLRIAPEETEDALPALLHQRRALARGRAVGVRIAQDLCEQRLRMTVEELPGEPSTATSRRGAPDGAGASFAPGLERPWASCAGRTPRKDMVARKATSTTRGVTIMRMVSVIRTSKAGKRYEGLQAICPRID